MLCTFTGRRKRGDVFTEEGVASKVCDDRIRDMGIRYAMASAKLVAEMAKWMDMCVDVEKLKAKDTAERECLKRTCWGDFPAKLKEN